MSGSENQADERILAVARARADGEREGTIAGLAEAAELALTRARADRAEDNAQWACATERIVDEILDELERRYGKADPRVLHHLKMRGFEPR